jgi:hypothetical protein
MTEEKGVAILVQRGKERLRLDLPEYWLPARLNWNGNDMGTADKPGCWVLSAGTPAARPCGP